MQPLPGARSRALIAAASAAAFSTASVALLTAAPAAAHVHVDAENPVPGTTSVLTFRVPGESESGALTTELRIDLPNITSVRTEVMPGWTTRLDRDVAAGTVSSVTWTAAPGVGISPDQFALFKISVRLPQTPNVSFPTTQTYSDGTVVRWNQNPGPDGSEPEHPAPQLTLSGAAGEGGADRPDQTHGQGAATVTSAPAVAAPAAGTEHAADNSARWLAGAALAVSAAAVAVALTARRRS
ncbi:YcnI family protein [Mycolicibacterium goodii]|uniref:YcnI family copper-binding membrane protein n=1 Tax=Mycolicibacterium goodii TaxID=134601 RepID=UPI000673A84D